MTSTHHLYFAFYHTPEIPCSNLQSLSRPEPPGLQMPTQFMEDWFLQIPKNPDGRQEVVQVIMEWRIPRSLI